MLSPTAKKLFEKSFLDFQKRLIAKNFVFGRTTGKEAGCKTLERWYSSIAENCVFGRSKFLKGRGKLFSKSFPRGVRGSAPSVLLLTKA